MLFSRTSVLALALVFVERGRAMCFEAHYPLYKSTTFIMIRHRELHDCISSYIAAAFHIMSSWSVELGHKRACGEC